MTERRVLLALSVAAALVLGGLGWLALTDPGPPPDRPRPPREARPRPPDRRTPPTSPGARAALPRPATPPGPRRRLDPNTKYALNDAVDVVVRGGRDACLAPWVAQLPEPRETEFVLDVVAVDGEVTDFGFRSLGPDEVPTDVLQCLADVVWGEDWGRFDGLTGETRLQRDFTVRPEPP